MAIRKSSSYTKIKVVPYTRTSKKKSKAYIKTIPPQKVVKFVMGNVHLYQEGKLPHTLSLVSIENAQVRSTALEACRQYIHKRLESGLGGQYFFRVIVYPHHIQRENKMQTGAGADKIQTGMQLSFGRPLEKAALIRSGDPIFFFALPNEKAVLLARDIIHSIKPKLPSKTKVIYKFVKNQVVQS
ncbi:MAG: 50S ribosomal protein L16 [Candidatus Pacearchaeota archaeon]